VSPRLSGTVAIGSTGPHNYGQGPTRDAPALVSGGDSRESREWRL